MDGQFLSQRMNVLDHIWTSFYESSAMIAPSDPDYIETKKLFSARKTLNQSTSR